jgi:hypothetical protein
MGKSVVREAASTSPEVIADLRLEDDDTDLEETA